MHFLKRLHISWCFEGWAMGDSTTQVERILKVKNDYYQVLQIKRSASATEIKSSYKKVQSSIFVKILMDNNTQNR